MAVATRPAAPPPAAAGATGRAPELLEVEPEVERWGPVTMVAALAGVAQAMLMAALIGGFFLARQHFSGTADGWPPKGDSLENFRALTLLFTLALASTFVQWAVHAARQGDQRHTNLALISTVFLQLAAADLVWFTVQHFGFGAGSSVYATLLYAMVGTFLAFQLAGVITSVLALARSIGGLVLEKDHQAVTAAAVQAHVLLVLWLSIWAVAWIRR